MTSKVNSVNEGRELMAKSLNNGTALEMFEKMLIHQRIDEKVAHELCYGCAATVLPMAKHETEIRSQTSGTYKILNLTFSKTFPA